MTTTEDPTNPAHPQQVGVILSLNHDQLTYSANRPRRTGAATRRLVESISKFGQGEPIVVRDNGDNTYEVLRGQHRAAACKELGIPVQARVRPDDPSLDQHQQAIQDTVEQFRAGNDVIAHDNSDEAYFVGALFELGVNAAETADQLGMDKRRVAKMRRVLKSERVATAWAAGQLDLNSADKLRHFEHNPEIIAALSDAGDDFDHLYQQYLLAEETDQRRDHAAAEYTSKGYTVEFDEIAAIDAGVALTDLATDDGRTATADDITDPHLWTVHLTPRRHAYHNETGELIERVWHKVDESTIDNPDREPSGGRLHAREVTIHHYWPTYYCRDITTAGLIDQRPRLSEEEAKKAHAAKLEAATRRAIARRCNQAALAATPVRRAWINNHILNHAEPVEGAQELIEAVFEAEPGLFGELYGRTMGAELFRTITTPKKNTGPEARANYATMKTLRRVLGAVESRLQRRDDTARDTAWKQPSEVGALELEFLRQHGYNPTEVERVYLRELTPDQVPDLPSQPAVTEPGHNPAA
ncbi:ParB/RepB/Spo0J family partition protein [Nocardia brasiliensis]|uniref:ParB/RepB/Spo0J family partition protein n=1 Tax=Nocardia brasiliensis TaxID=37326 RepID=UPI002454990E|nr:ParB N-terminal domain-containing protein [Nocardia brasiliensis]